MMASDDMLSWLKATIEGDKAAAEADRDDQVEWAAEYMTGLGPSGGVASVHIRLQAPLHTIARCEAELEILDQVLPEVRRIAVRLAEEFGGICPDDWLSPSEKMLLKTLARGYRNRAGWNPDWVSG